jgi:hypothetical protein
MRRTRLFGASANQERSEPAGAHGHTALAGVSGCLAGAQERADLMHCHPHKRGRHWMNMDHITGLPR